MLAFYYMVIVDYPEEIVEIDEDFKLDKNTPIVIPGERYDNKWEEESHPHLKKALTMEQHNELVDLLASFVTLMEKHNITYLMYEGTLLGSYFFHDFVPWDDDLDLMIAWKDREKLLKVFSDHKLRETFDVCSYQDIIDWYSLETLEGRNPKLQKRADRDFYTKHADFKFKFFLKSSKNAGDFQWKWPFIDIKFYKETEDTVYKLDNIHPQHGTIHKRDFFPLHLRPFAGLWLPAPRDTRSWLRKKYAKFICVSHSWDHVKEVRQSRSHVSCSDILGIYPHVHRSKPIEAGYKNRMGVIESLMLGPRILHSVWVDEPWYNITGYYDLQ